MSGVVNAVTSYFAPTKRPAATPPSIMNTPTSPAQFDDSTVTPFYPVPAGFRRPRGFLIINGQKVAAIKITTNSTSHFTPDSWTAELSLYNQPQGVDLQNLSTYDPTTIVEVHFGFLGPNQKANEFPAESTPILTGQIDEIQSNLTTGEVSLTGRDLTAKLVDNKTSNRWPNLTSSQAVTLIANLFGLVPLVTPTKTLIGKYFNNGYSSQTSASPYWDFITFLAQQENFDAYIYGKVLYFGPPPADTDPTPWVFWIKTDGRGRVWGNVIDMTLHRDANLAKDISVTVITHDNKTGRSYTANASRAGTYLGSSSRSRSADTVQSYIIRKPGLTQGQADQLAMSELAEISKFEKEYTVTIEGDVTFTQRKMSRVIGTGTDFDTSYYVRNITRSWDAEGGFVMTINGKNVPAENEAQISGESATGAGSTNVPNIGGDDTSTGGL